MVLIVNYQEGYAPMSFLWVSYPLEWLFLRWFAKLNTTLLLYPGLGPAMAEFYSNYRNLSIGHFLHNNILQRCHIALFHAATAVNHVATGKLSYQICQCK